MPSSNDPSLSRVPYARAALAPSAPDPSTPAREHSSRVRALARLLTLAAAGLVQACGATTGLGAGDAAADAAVTSDAPAGGGCPSAANACGAAPSFAVGSTFCLDTCGGATIPAAICWTDHPRSFFRVTAPTGTPLHFVTSPPGASVTVWGECGATSPAECGGPNGSFTTTHNESRLFGVERFDVPCGEVTVTVTQ